MANKPKHRSEAWWDLVYDEKNRIWDLVNDLINRETKHLDPAVDEQIRTMLTEEYRFWKSHTLPEKTNGKPS